MMDKTYDALRHRAERAEEQLEAVAEIRQTLLAQAQLEPKMSGANRLVAMRALSGTEVEELLDTCDEICDTDWRQDLNLED